MFKSTKKISLRLILIVPFVLQIFAAVGLVGYLSFIQGQKAVNDLANQLIDKASQQVDERLDTYLALPQQLNQMNAEAISAGQLDLKDALSSEKYFWRQAKVFKTISYVGYILTDGTESGAGRWVKGVDLLVYENLSKEGKASDYIADEQGNRAKLLQTYEFDPLSLPSYKDAVKAGKPSWSPIFTLEVNNIQIADAGKAIQTQDKTSNIGLEYTVNAPARQPFYDKKGNLLGVLAIDLLLPDISKFLRNLQITPRGQVFIMERDGQLVGSSGNHPILHKVNDKIERFTALNSPDPLIRAIASELEKRYNNFSAIPDNEELNISFNRQRYFSQVTPWQDEYGLNWLVVVSVPESDFMGQINTNTRITILLCLGALGLATLSGIYTANWITQPILRLSQATQAIADGELNQTVKETSVNELSILARSFNRMAQQLRDSFIALEKTNFQLEQTNEGLEVRVVERTEELSQALHELQQTQAQLVQTEKMSSLGQMVAGIAHEINNPANFIHGNLECAGNYLQDLLETLKLYQKYYPTPTDEIQHHVEATDIDFIMEDLPKMLNSMQEGTRRIREIVLNLRNFSRLDEATMKQVDIHQGIDSTLLILGHRLKAKSRHPEIEVIQNYGKIPLVECYAGQLNQVFMNLLSNAIDALEENNNHPGIITISTYTDNAQQVIVKIADNGAGMTSDIQSKIFDPFFTTKAVGRGTGLGLSISYQIIVSLHGGLLNCTSIQGKGTEFTICIPTI